MIFLPLKTTGNELKILVYGTESKVDFEHLFNCSQQVFTAQTAK